MTRDEILAMEAGPPLDIALGKALGCHVVKEQTSRDHFRYTLVVPFGINSIDWTTEAGAWSGMPPLSETWEGMRLVVEALTSDGTAVEVLFSSDGCDVQIFADKGYAKAEAKTAPHAVALAAMLAVGGGDGN